MESNFYVENARLLSYGLSNIGTGITRIDITGNEPIDQLSGKLIGLGFHSNRQFFVDLLIQYTNNINPFIRRSAYIGLSFAVFLGAKINVEHFHKGFHDYDLEVRKVALIGFGLAYFRNPSFSHMLDSYLHDKEWKIRSATGLAYSFLSNGNPEHFSRFIDILKKEESPYVKVCSCWYISNAFAGTTDGLEDFKKLLTLDGEENSFFRDMACIGLGLSYLGTSNQSINELLIDRIRNDNHPYVRESAFFGLSLCNYQNLISEVLERFDEGLMDDSMIVRSGASLSYGIATMGMKSLELNLHNYTDSSVLWGLTLSEGLADVKPSITRYKESYVQWGYHISNGFRNNIILDQKSNNKEVQAYQNGINAGLIGSDINIEQRNAVRLIVPGLYHYLNFDSFWWGLWVLTVLGTTLNMRRNV